MSAAVPHDAEPVPGSPLDFPIGLRVEETVAIGMMPAKFQFGADRSVVRLDDLGQSWKVKFLITPATPSLLEKPLFDGSGRPSGACSPASGG